MSEKTIHALIGARIEMKRKSLNMSVVQFSKRIDMFPSTIELVESGQKQLTLQQVYQICRKLRCEVHEIMPMVCEVMGT